MNIAYNMDCLEAMRKMPDKCFDLAVVDPPFGNGGKDFKRTDKSRFGGRFDKYKTKTDIIQWDSPPPPEYFEQLMRVSKNQIIWGANYFEMPPCRCFLVWNKPNIPDGFSMAQAEYAWTSFNESAKVLNLSSARDKEIEHFHPTEKPVGLYAWIYRLFAKDGDRILDTHLGSGSSRIAAYDAGLDFVGFEIDKDYYEKQEERFAAYTAQTSLYQMAGV